MSFRRSRVIKCLAVLIVVFASLLVLEITGQLIFRVRHGYWLFNQESAAYTTLFGKHPYLVAEQRRNARYTSRDGIVFTHNELGAREKPGAITKGRGLKRILVFGGSSTYGIGVSDDQTWPYYLQQALGPGYEVMNFGVPGYTTVEHIIQTALNISDLSPDICLYYVGWNDTRNTHVAKLRTDYSDFHGRSQYNHLMLGSLKIGNRSVIIQASAFFLRKLFIREPEGVYLLEGTPDKFTARNDERALSIYRRNIRLLISLCRAQEVQPVFIPQIMNYGMLTSDKPYDWIPLVRQKDLEGLMGAYNNVLREVCRDEEVDFVGEVLQLKYERASFVDDLGHFSPQGGLEFARAVAGNLRAHALATSKDRPRVPPDPGINEEKAKR
jgi:lysophospholipase L1-like esterase